jgi:hypothetical protein
MTYDGRMGRVVEWMGPAAVLGLVWTAHADGATLNLLSDGWILRLGGRRLRLPSWLLGDVRVREWTEDVYDDVFTLHTRVTHPLLGPTFGYRGRFRLTRGPSSHGHSWYVEV